MPANASGELAALAARVKAAGDGALRLKTLRTLRAAAQPMVPAVRNAALTQLPKRGGLNVHVASQRITVSTSLVPSSAAVRLKTSAPDTSQLDAGFVRHPLPGNRRGKGEWVTQSVPQARGYWSDTLRDRSREVTPALLKAIREIAAEIRGA